MWMLVPIVLCLAPTGAAKRPPQATQGREVAHVVAGKGAVTVVDAKKFSFAAASNVPVLDSDSVQVPVDGFVVLQLAANGYVVRIDEDLTLAVRDIALLNAPKATASVDAQLDQLLSKDEKNGLQRMTGWYASPTAANVPSMREERAEAASPKKKSSAPQREFARKGGGSKAAQPLEDSIQTEAQTAAPTTSPAPGAAAAAPKVSPPNGGGGSAPNRGLGLSKETAPAPPPPPPAPALVADADLSQCLSQSLMKLNVRMTFGKSVVVRYRKGDVVRVQLPNAVPTPACAQAWFDAHASAEPGWQTLEVPLQ